MSHTFGVRQVQKQKTRRALMDAALALLEEQSLSSLGLREVTRAVGVAPTAFYRHFDDMEELGLVLVEQSFGTLSDMLRLARTDAAHWPDAIRGSVDVVVRHVAEHEPHMRFIARERYGGVRRIRLTGGEPLVRRDMIELARRLGSQVGTGLDELTMTTNGTRLAEHAEALFDAGMRLINVSLDSRDPATFRHITRHGDVTKVLDGIAAARAAGLAVKINMVALKWLNEAEIPEMLGWTVAEGMDLTLIETMPLGVIDDHMARAQLFGIIVRAADGDLARMVEAMADRRVAAGDPGGYAGNQFLAEDRDDAG